MDQKKWEKVLANYTAEKEFIKDGYYRVRPVEEGYQMAYLVPGLCGETLIHPEITLEVINGKAVPIRLMDLETTPTTRLSAKAGDQEQIEAQAEMLLEKFVAAKNLGR
ncbi:MULTISPECIES: hypothetical protein [Enterococcus]|uniref:Uncharacterized protein n=1 Tax=Candidatus Enterococcus ferrettii TaxID=2815324 RepID=A0ABV0ELR2_9ENTE|nr:hypothetical protein [Enterococcus sp. 665A]MBO1341555.1 hypothetical protein [Enterococcus sp. 665A]